MNMLKRYIKQAMFCNIDNSDENFPDCISRNSNQTETREDVHLDLLAKQKEQLTDLLQEFSDVFTDVPSRTDLIQLDFSVKDGINGVHMKLYRIPKTLETEVQKEVTKMLENGDIKQENI